MRLGGVMFCAESIEELDALLPLLDRHGLSAIPAPNGIDTMSDDEAAAFGEHARSVGLVIGESMLRCNVMIADPAARAAQIERVRERLHKATVMGCRCIFIGVGSVRQVNGRSALDPYMFSGACSAEFAEVISTLLEPVDPGPSTKLAIEPTNRSFFSTPEAMAEVVSRIDHPRFAVHLDLANLVSQANYFESSSLIERSFSLLAPAIASAHLKDIAWDTSFYSLKLDEVAVGEGVVDYPSYLGHLAALDPDLTCFCEHLETEEEYARNFAQLHATTDAIGRQFTPRAVRA